MVGSSADTDVSVVAGIKTNSPFRQKLIVGTKQNYMINRLNRAGYLSVQSDITENVYSAVKFVTFFNNKNNIFEKLALTITIY